MFPGGSAGSSIVTAAAQVTAVALVRSLTQKLLPAKGMAKKKKKKSGSLGCVGSGDKTHYLPPEELFVVSTTLENCRNRASRITPTFMDQ